MHSILMSCKAPFSWSITTTVEIKMVKTPNRTLSMICRSYIVNPEDPDTYGTRIVIKTTPG